MAKPVVNVEMIEASDEIIFVRIGDEVSYCDAWNGNAFVNVSKFLDLIHTPFKIIGFRKTWKGIDGKYFIARLLKIAKEFEEVNYYDHTANRWTIDAPWNEKGQWILSRFDRVLAKSIQELMEEEGVDMLKKK